jgi:hypothetical protein
MRREHPTRYSSLGMRDLSSAPLISSRDSALWNSTKIDTRGNLSSFKTGIAENFLLGQTERNRKREENLNIKAFGIYYFLLNLEQKKPLGLFKFI